MFLALLRSKATTCEMHLQYYDVTVVVCKHRHLYFVYNLIFAPGFMSMSYLFCFWFSIMASFVFNRFNQKLGNRNKIIII